MKLRRGAAVLMALICCRALGLTEGRSVSDSWESVCFRSPLLKIL